MSSRIMWRRRTQTAQPSGRVRLQLHVLEARDLPSTYYVAPNGDDTANGSSGAPWQTLQQAANTVQAGDTVVIRPGHYAGFIMGWDNPTAGTAAAPITFKADPTAAPGSVVIDSRNSKTAVGIDLEPECDFITISGVTIQGGGNGDIATFPDRGEGIKVTGDHDVVINTTVEGVDYGFGILADNANDVVLQGDSISGTGSHGNADLGHGIYLSGSLDGAVVRDNVIHDNDYIGIHINGDASEGGIGIVTHTLIDGNFIYDNGQNAINADGLQSSIIQNNVIYGYAKDGITLYQGDAADGSKNNVIVNNTIVSTLAGAGPALRLLDGATGNLVLNNILLGGGNVAECFSNDSLPGLLSDYNVVSGLIQSDDTGATESLSDWRAQGYDAHSLIATAPALFVSSATNNYHLRPFSPAVDAGTTFHAPPTDIAGVPRPHGAGIDIGAYELLSFTIAYGLQWSITVSIDS
jgi:parallel beta-helix repeat protein